MAVSDRARRSGRWWLCLHILLFLLTFLTTTAFGYALQRSFAAGQSLDYKFILDGYDRLLFGDHMIWSGVIYSVPVLAILLAHEFGHFVSCRRWNVDATLPFFLPSPTLLGTLGAFIRIRAPIYSRRSLFDIGVSGPIAGFVVLLPFLAAGVWMSKVVPGANSNDALIVGTPLVMRAFELTRFPNAQAVNIALHPVAIAAWAGLLATSINLLPAGQLDGGHILYAVGGNKAHRIASLAVMGFLVLLAVLISYWPSLVWAVLLFFFRRHPLVYDNEPLDKKRLAVSGLALAILVLSI